jgi:iron(III) transport system substrate-binding protein
MSTKRSLKQGMACFAAALLASCTGGETEPDSDKLVIYSSRHYDSDYALYKAFEEAKGVTVEVIEADGDLLIERVRADGASNPPDVIITVDSGRLWRADQEGLFAPAESEFLNERIPASMRHADGHWYGLSSRARVIVYARDRVDADALAGYESLADPAFEGRVCARSSGNIYNISLLAALIDRWGEARAQDWATKVAANFARDPQGGDSDQIRAVAAGECDAALVNHYYFARMARSEEDDVSGLAVFWPEASPGVHVNISGAGVASGARNPELALSFIEFAASDDAQRLFPELTNEYPAVTSVSYSNDVLDAMGKFTADPLSGSVIGGNQEQAQRVFDRAGWP